MDYISKSEQETGVLAAALASHLSPPDIIALEGDLGAGKTAFARALIRAANGKQIEVPSPTFTLVQTYPILDYEIWHFDLYRLTGPDDAYELGIEDAFASAISLIEWPDRLTGRLPPDWLEIHFSHTSSPEHRLLSLTGHGSWKPRLDTIGKLVP